MTEREAIRHAWLSDDRDALFAIINFGDASWHSRAGHLLEVFEEEGVDLRAAVGLAQDFEGRLSQSGQITVSSMWRSEMAPKILQLQSGASFVDSNLVTLAAAASAPILIGSDWQTTAQWLDTWNVHNLVAAATVQPIHELKALKDRGILPPALYGHAPIFHPLILHSMRVRLRESEFSSTALPLCQWLVDNVFVTPHPQVTLETVFAAGPVVFDLAQHHGVEIKDGSVSGNADWIPLVEAVIRSVVKNSVGTPDVLPPWRGQQDTVRALIDGCSYWHARELAKELRGRVKHNLNSELNTLTESLADQSAELSKKGLMPENNGKRIFVAKPQDYARRPLPNYRGATTATWDQDSARQPYTNVLQAMDASSRRLAAASSIVQEVANNLAAKRKTFERELGNPWMQAALPDYLQGGLNDLVVGNHAVRHFLKEQVGMARVDFRAYDNGRLIVDTPAWSTVINDQADAPEKMLAAWARLEIWDKLRGRMLANAQVGPEDISTTLLAELDAKWELNIDKPAPAADTLDAVRPLLAAAAHLGLAGDRMAARAGDLDQYLEKAVLDEETQFTALAAMRLELGITMVVTGIPIGEAFPQITGGLGTLLVWAGRCLVSQYAWEARAGMNTFNLLARLAETSGDLFFTTPLASAVGPAVDIIERSIAFIKDGKPVPGSDLALAFAASDLLRYTHGRAAGISGLDVRPIWWPSGDIGQLIDDLVASYTDPDKLAAIQTTAGVPTQLLLLALTRIKLAQYTRERQLAVWPPHTGGRGLARKMQFVRPETLRDLKASLRTLCSQEPILLRGLPPAHTIFTVRTPLQAGNKWTLKAGDNAIIEYQVNAQTTTAKDVVDGLAQAWQELNGTAPAGWVLRADPSPQEKFADLIFEQLNDASLDLAMVTTSQGGNSTLRYTQDVPWWETRYWASIYTTNDEDLTDNNLEPLEGKEPILRFVNWADAFQYDALADLLATAAALEDAFPDHPIPLTGDVFAATPDLLRDIDGRYEGEFNRLAIGAAKTKLGAFVATLTTAQDKYIDAIRDLGNQERHDQLLEHLKQPLRFATADFKQQIEVALAEVREAEAELEAAEHDSLAAGFEQFAAELLVEAAKLEVRRQEAIVTIEAKKGEIALLERDITQINWDSAIVQGDISEELIKQANLHIARANIQEEIAATARGFILEEIKLVLGLIGAPPGDPNAGEYRHEVTVKDQNNQEINLGFANGRIGVMALQTQYTLATKLQGELEKAEHELREAERRADKAKKKAKRNKLINSACRFIGAVVGTIIGGPAGAALGAEIGEAMAEVAIGVMDNRPPGEILVGLVDNAYSIAGAAGYDLETALNDLGTKVGDELTGYLDKLEANLGPIFDSLPKVVDKQLFQDTLEVLDLKEIEGVGPLLNGALDGLKTDLRGLGNLGTVLKDSVAFDSVDQFKKHLASQLLKNTDAHVKELESIAKKVGTTWDSLQNDPQKQQEAMERFGSLVLANMASKAGEHRSGILQQWITEKKGLGDNGYWDKVKEEGEALLRDLFPDANAFAKAKANVAAALLNPKTHRGQIQDFLTPWQTEFDVRLNKIMAPEDGGAPSTEVEAWSQQVTHLRSAIEQFEDDNGLFAWMNGKNNEQIDDLYSQLKKLQEKDELQQQQVAIAEIDVNVAQGDLQIAKQELARARNAIEAAEKAYQQSELGVEIANLNNQVADLSRMKAITEEDMKEKSAQAAQERQKAAAARVKAAQAALDAAKASLNAARRRGAEAGRIQNALAMPPLALPDVAGVAAQQARTNHDEALKNALRAYREVLRFCFSVELRDIPALRRPDLPAANGDSTWGTVLTTWMNDVSQALVDQQVVTTLEDTFEYDLTAAHIRSLMSPEGLRLVVGSGLDEKPVITVLDKAFADTLKVGPVSAGWRQALITVGVAVSEKAVFEGIPNEPGQFWLSDPDFSELRVSVFQAVTGDSEGNRVGGWTIPLSSDTYEDRLKYRVWHDAHDAQGRSVIVRWEPSPKFNAGRSCLPGAIVVSMPNPLVVRTGRLVGVYLGIKDRNDGVIGSDTYDISVMFQGAAWQKDDYLQLLERRKLPQNRVIYEGATPEPLLNMLASRMNVSIADLKSFELEGTPLWGATVIRLTGEAGGDNKPFERARLRLIYKWYSSPN
jgi:hypothetical protein